MPYMELPAVGRADDLLGLLVRAEAIRYARAGVRLPDKPAGARTWVEPLGNALGRLLAAGALLLPDSALTRGQDALWRKLAAPNLFPFEPQAPGLLQARSLIDEVSPPGRRAAVLVPFTHPPVVGEWLHLNIELTRHAMWALGRLRPERRPKLVVAVDPFALDGFSLLVEGVYAAFMGTLHLGFDRLAGHRGPASRWLVGSTSWTRVAPRLLRWLSAGRGLGIPLGGGVPTTSRALYTARELVWSLRRSRPGRIAPAEVLRRLAAADPDFAEFQRSGLMGRHRSAWRLIEGWLLATLSGIWPRTPEVPSAADEARLTPAARRAAEACARAMGFEGDAVERALAALDAELRRETPYRVRLFRVLARRVAARGTPVVLVPLSHGAPPNVAIRWGEPAALVEAAGDQATVARPGGARETLAVGDFARRFVDENLP